MSIGAILVGISLLIATVPFVASPLLKEKRRKPMPDGLEPTSSTDLHTQALSALRDLEFDHQLGKINPEDYTDLRSRLLIQAAATLETEEKQDAEIDIRLEEAIRARREQLATHLTCSQCGGTMDASDRFCRSCGQPLDNVCPTCNRKVKPKDLFCSSCGTALAKPLATSQETEQHTQSDEVSQ